MRIDVFTIFPALVDDYCNASLLGRARQRQLLNLNMHDLRAGAVDGHKSVDDAPFGGGPGMVLAPEPVTRAIEGVDAPRPLYLLGPSGRRLDQPMAIELAGLDGFSLLCGRYEGIDQRIIDTVCDGEISVGDFVLAGGEAAALVVIEATTRLLPGVMGNDSSATSESFAGDGLLEYPQYTRPAEFRGERVPDVLLGGNHAEIADWRRAASLHSTAKRRPDLIRRRGGFTVEEAQLLTRFGFDAHLGELESQPVPRLSRG